MTTTNPGAMTRIRNILEDLEAVRENLLALSDDIWYSIDHNDPDDLEKGVEFKRAYNAKAAAFDLVASDLSKLVQQYTSVNLEEGEQSGSDDAEQNERLIAELNREEPHTLDEDFTYKRPQGFILNGQAATGITTWQRLFELACQQLFARNPGLFRGLHEDPAFITNRGHHWITTDQASLRKALHISDGVYIESNASANTIRDVIRRLLQAYNIAENKVQLFLRQDRDAGRDAA